MQREAFKFLKRCTFCKHRFSDSDSDEIIANHYRCGSLQCSICTTLRFGCSVEYVQHLEKHVKDLKNVSSLPKLPTSALPTQEIHIIKNVGTASKPSNRIQLRIAPKAPSRVLQIIAPKTSNPVQLKITPKPPNRIQQRYENQNIRVKVQATQDIVPVEVDQNSNENEIINLVDDEDEEDNINAYDDNVEKKMDQEQLQAFLRAYPSSPKNDAIPINEEPEMPEFDNINIANRKRKLDCGQYIYETYTISPAKIPVLTQKINCLTPKKIVMHPTRSAAKYMHKKISATVQSSSDVTNVNQEKSKQKIVHSSSSGISSNDSLEFDEQPLTKDYQNNEEVYEQPVFQKSNLVIKKVSACYGNKYGYSDIPQPTPPPTPLVQESKLVIKNVISRYKKFRKADGYQPILINQVFGSSSSQNTEQSSIKQFEQVKTQLPPPIMMIKSVHSYADTISGFRKTKEKDGVDEDDFESMIKPHYI